MSDKKRKITLVVLGVLIVLLIAAGVTYAYFEARINQGAHGDVNVTGDTTDNLLFDVSNDISLSINQFNFGTGAGNLTSTAKASASLRANSTNNTATYNYYLYFKIDTNEYIYTTTDSKPEIVLTVTDPNGNPVTAIEGLNYVNATNADGTVVSGFDITTASGLFAIASKHQIISNSSTEATLQEWNITATFINLATDQEANTGKMMSGKVMIQKDEVKPLFTDYIIGLYTTQGANNLYHHDGTLENGINDGSYRYAGSYETTNNWVCFGTDAETCDDEHLYRIIGVFNEKIIGEDGNPTGAIEQNVKLIKAYEATEASLGTTVLYAGHTGTGYYKGKFGMSPSYYWSGSGDNESNNWTTSTLNTDILNGTYLTTLGTAWTSKITVTRWMIGGNTFNNIVRTLSATAYQNEVVNSVADSNGNKTTNAKVGLMYVSDYGFAASQSNWQINVESYNNDTNRNNNWLFFGTEEWAITRYVDFSNFAFGVGSFGNVMYSEVYSNCVVRPTFYLNSDVMFAGGSGTVSDPYRIGV